MKKIAMLFLSLILIFTLAGCASSANGDISGNGGVNTLAPISSESRISITAGDTVLYANMYDNDTAREFIKTLPFTLPTIERSGLAKGVHLPQYIDYEEDKLTREYKLGEIGYWPGGDIAIFYTDHLFDRTIVDVVQIGQIESGVEVFLNYSGSVTIERVQVEQIAYEVDSFELHANSNGADIFGVAYQPVNAGNNLPAVILSHGFGGNYNTNSRYAMELAKLGYFAYTFDFRGGSTNSRSQGSNLKMSVFTEENDLKSVVSMVQSLDYIDSNRIYLFGTSQGGLVSAMTAADIKDEIKGLILLYPAFSIVDDAKAKYKTADDIPDTVYYLWMTVGKVYFENLIDYDVYGDVTKYADNVLIIHGDNDNIVPLSSSKKAVQEYNSATLKIIKGAGHGFSGSAFSAALSYTVDYLQAKNIW